MIREELTAYDRATAGPAKWQKAALFLADVRPRSPPLFLCVQSMLRQQARVAVGVGQHGTQTEREGSGLI